MKAAANQAQDYLGFNLVNQHNKVRESKDLSPIYCLK